VTVKGLAGKLFYHLMGHKRVKLKEQRAPPPPSPPRSERCDGTGAWLRTRTYSTARSGWWKERKGSEADRSALDNSHLIIYGLVISRLEHALYNPARAELSLFLTPSCLPPLTTPLTPPPSRAKLRSQPVSSLEASGLTDLTTPPSS
jgi:hypothetical protein